MIAKQRQSIVEQDDTVTGFNVGINAGASAAYTGCRIEELCILKLENVSDDKVEIVDAKSEAGWRTIPIHHLVECD